jgi:hypothetical protein
MRTQGVFRGVIMLEKVNVVDPIILCFVIFIIFEDPMGRLTWYFILPLQGHIVVNTISFSVHGHFFVDIM